MILTLHCDRAAVEWLGGCKNLYCMGLRLCDCGCLQHLGMVRGAQGWDRLRNRPTIQKPEIQKDTSVKMEETCLVHWGLCYLSYYYDLAKEHRKKHLLIKITELARQSSVDNQKVPTAEESHWHKAFVTLKSHFIELEKKCPEALMQLSHKVEVTKYCGIEK
ncbi:hypothetical protein L345_05675, partial [Ophiophagus hannah]